MVQAIGWLGLHAFPLLLLQLVHLDLLPVVAVDLPAFLLVVRLTDLPVLQQLQLQHVLRLPLLLLPTIPFQAAGLQTPL